MPRRILSLWLPLWHTDRWRRQHPDLPLTTPLILHAPEGNRQMVQAADRAARRAGVRPGMTLAHAQALMPGLMVAAATPREDEQALEKLAAWGLWLSPIVAVDVPDGIWIDTTGCDHLQSGEAAMLEAVRTRIQERGYVCRLALADTPGAAHALARHSRAPVTLVTAGSQMPLLTPLPVGSLRLPGETTAGLQRLGLTTIGHLAAAPRAPLVKRFGADVLRQLDRACGHAPEPIRPIAPREALVVRRGFVEPIGTAEAIATVIDVLVQLACTKLVTRGLGARLLDLLCENVDGTVQAVRVGTASPVQDSTHLARLLHEQIDTIAPGFGIEAMQLVVARAEAMGVAAPVALLAASGAPNDRPTDLDCLIDRLRNRVGAARVYRLIEHPSQIPERAQMRHPAGLSAAPLPALLPLLPRPTRLLDPPEAISVIALLPEGAPQLFVRRRRRHRVQAADGPERLHGEWWSHEAEYGAIRDYWIVEDTHGARFWLYRRGDGTHAWSGAQDWYLHGVFG